MKTAHKSSEQSVALPTGSEVLTSSLKEIDWCLRSMMRQTDFLETVIQEIKTQQHKLAAIEAATTPTGGDRDVADSA